MEVANDAFAWATQIMIKKNNSINPSQTVHFNVKEPLVNVKVADILVLYQSTSKNCFRQTKKHFQKLKEVFHHNMMIYNNLSQFLHRC